MQKQISTVHRCFFCIACVILVILAASVATVTVLILQERDGMNTGLEEHKKSQLEANATITRLEGKLEELQTKGSRLKAKLDLEELQRNTTTQRVNQLEAKLEELQTQLVNQLSKDLEEQKQKMELLKNTTTQLLDQLRKDLEEQKRKMLEKKEVKDIQ